MMRLSGRRLLYLVVIYSSETILFLLFSVLIEPVLGAVLLPVSHLVRFILLPRFILIVVLFILSAKNFLIRILSSTAFITVTMFEYIIIMVIVILLLLLAVEAVEEVHHEDVVFVSRVLFRLLSCAIVVLAEFFA